MYKLRQSLLVGIVERRHNEGGQLQLKIHYFGYTFVYDKWRAADEIVEQCQPL